MQQDELSKRHKAIRIRLAGTEGLNNLTCAHTSLVNRTPPEMKRAIVSIRRRLAAHANPQTRYALNGGCHHPT